jgi:hypothetical protein
MDSQIAMRPSRPQTIKELVAQAESFNFLTNIPFKHWIRAAETLYQEVCQVLFFCVVFYLTLSRPLLQSPTAISVELT